MKKLDELLSSAESGKPNNGFTEEQLNQIQLAERNGVPNTIIKEHQDWCPVLMNFCWCYERDGKSIQVYLELDKWCRETEYNIVGELIGEGNPNILFQLVDCYNVSGSLPAINFKGRKYTKKEKEVCAEFWCIYSITSIANGGRTTNCGRICLPDNLASDMQVIMGEGIEKAKDIAEQLSNIADGNCNREAIRLGMYNAYDKDRQWAKINILLGADDMNIRGKQLIYGAEFCNGDIQTLFKLIQGRDENLVKYINKRCATDLLNRIRNGEVGDLEYLAVTGGASFVGRDNNTYKIDILNAEELAAANVDKVTKDLSTADVFKETPLAQAEDIIEWNGFKLVRKVELPKLFNEKQYGILWFNDVTGDYIKANAIDRMIQYGGCNVHIFREDGIQGTRHGSSGPVTNRFNNNEVLGTYYYFNANGGLFTKYRELPSYQWNPDTRDYSLLGWGSSALPVIDYWEYFEFRANQFADQSTLVKCRDDISYLYRTGMGYTISNILSLMVLFNDIDNYQNADKYKAGFKEWFINRYVIQEFYWTQYDYINMLICMAFAIGISSMPEQIVDTWISAIIDSVIYESNNAQSNMNHSNALTVEAIESEVWRLKDKEYQREFIKYTKILKDVEIPSWYFTWKDFK